MPGWLLRAQANSQKAAFVQHLDRLWSSLKAFLDGPKMSGLITRKALSIFDVNHERLQAFWEQIRLVRLDLLIEVKAAMSVMMVLRVGEEGGRCVCQR